ncbi:MAG: winged helix-turn-helix transcriptional regulator [Candidatus Hodarchaeales archaeon]
MIDFSSYKIIECAAGLSLKILGKKWTLYILCELLMSKELYFSELQERIKGIYGESISARVLSESLKGLENHDVVIRTVHSDKMPIRVGYSLTEKGEDFSVVFSVLKGWGMKWGGINVKKCQSFTCVHNTVPVINVDEAKKLIEVRKIEDK